MILVRDIFYLKFGKAKEAKTVLNEGRNMFDKLGFSRPKAMTDLTGHSYTLVMETEWKSLGDMESTLQKSFGDKDWQNWYQKFVPLVDSGSREIYTLLD